VRVGDVGHRVFGVRCVLWGFGVGLDCVGLSWV